RGGNRDVPALHRSAEAASGEFLCESARSLIWRRPTARSAARLDDVWLLRCSAERSTGRFLHVQFGKSDEAAAIWHWIADLSRAHARTSYAIGYAAGEPGPPSVSHTQFRECLRRGVGRVRS